MPQGLQIFNAGGDLILDVTDRLTRVLGEFETGTSSGSVSNPNLSSGTPWFTMRDLGKYEMLSEASCSVSINSSSISWTFGSSGTKTNKKIVYGVY